MEFFPVIAKEGAIIRPVETHLLHSGLSILVLQKLPVSTNK